MLKRSQRSRTPKFWGRGGNPELSGLSQYKMLSIVWIIMFFFVENLFAQPDILWTKTFGGSSYDYGRSVQQTSDGGYIITGRTESYGAGSSDVWLIKTDVWGDTLWTNTFGGSSYDWGNSVQQTSDGGYIITGRTESYGAGSSDVWLIKTDVWGDTLWTNTFGGSSYDWGNSVQQTSDGGYIMTGGTSSYGAGSSDIWLIKTDVLGDTVWTKTIGWSASSESGSSIEQTSDQGYIIAGSMVDEEGVGVRVLYLVKTDASGNTSWTKTFGMSDWPDAGGNYVQQTLDGGYIVTGYVSTEGLGYPYDMWLIKTNSSGATTWTKTFGGSSSDYGKSVQQTSNGGYIITGYTASYGAGSSDVWLIKTDASGDTLWTKTFGGSGTDGGYSVQQTSDEGYIITGSTYSYGAGSYDVWLIKIQPSTDLISPNGGETLAGGSTNPIIWSTDALGFNSIRILLSTNGGVSYTDTIATGISPDNTSYTWILPIINSYTCRVKVQILDDLDNVISEDESNSNFSIRTYPTVTSPNGGEIWADGSTHPIIWSTFGEGFNSYRLLLSTDSGVSYTDTIATDISPDNTSYNWTLPVINSYTCRVRVQILDSLNNVISQDESNSNFSIRTYPTIISPDGGEIWAGGSTHPITWSTFGYGFGGYRLLFSTDGGSSYTDTISTGISPDSTSYNWTLPIINSNTCRVKVQILDSINNIISEDESNSNFSILTYPTIISPNGGETWAGGSTHPITWSTFGYGFGGYRLLFSTDGGSSYTDTISTGISPDSTSYSWELPQINSNTCRVKLQILDSLDNVISEDASDGNFTIELYATLISPNGGENLAVGSTHTITWSTFGEGFNSYQLFFSIDGGTSYPDTIATGISPDSTSYNWTTPQITSDSVRVKIQVIGSEGQVLAKDWSDGNFQIDATPPAVITDVKIIDRTYKTITLEWTEPGDDSLSGSSASEYDIRYALFSISESNWDAATTLDSVPTPSWPGGYQTFTVTNLLTDTLYYFGMKTRDEHYHWSGLSNVAFGLTKPYPVLASSQYPMFHYNEQHTGRSPYYGPLSNNIKWFFATYYPVSSSPIVGPDGTIYFSSENDTLYAVNTDGTKKWAINLYETSTKSSPAIAIDSTIYIGNDYGTLTAYTYNGYIKWEYDVSGSIVSSPAIGTDGAVYFGSTNNTIYSVNADGTLKWTFNTDGPIYSSTAISPDGIVYIGSNDHKLYAIHPDGSLDWSVNTPAEIMSSPAVDISTGVIYVGCSNGKLYAVNPNGTIKWTYTTQDSITSSPAIGADGTVFFGSHDGKVYGLNSDGDLIWSYETDGKVRSSPVIDARGYIYIGSDDATLYCFDGSDGTVVWSGVTGDKVTSSPAISANSTLYVGSYDGRLYAFGTTAPVTLLSPNGGEEWIKNTLHDILWSTTGSIVNIKLSYSKDSGNSYTPISDSEIDDGIYSWTLPDIISSTCRVKVVAFDAGGDSAWDASDADFSIIADTTIVSVWPGDLDNNGVVEATDVLPLAIHWRKTGLIRSDASYSWEGQEITPWTDSAATYTDANGDGEVNITDLLPICVNWGKTHTVSTVLAIYEEEFDVNEHYEVLNVIYQEVKNADSGPGFEIRLYLEKLLGIRIPEDYNLSQNYPNPFNAETVINYQLPKAGRVELTVYNLMGEVIKELVNENKDAGFYEVIWDGTNTVGNQVSSGVYFYHVRVNEFRSIKKLVIIK